MRRFNCLIALLLILTLPMTVFAAGSIDMSRSTGITIGVVYDKVPVAGMAFGAIRVSTVDETGELTVLNRFSKFASDLDIRGKNDEAWQEMAQILELELYTWEDVTLDAVAKTDESGIARFDNLPKGLYLIVSEGVEQDGYVYTTAPFFVNLPEQDLKSNSWNYDIVANAKPEQNPVRDDYTVEKVWKDSCHPGGRPQSITVELLRDGQVYDTITLPEGGRWQHTWENLDVNHKWTVREKAVSGYSEPEIKKDGNIFTITNTCNKPVGSTSPGLPQTGQLWWPVPILLLAGLALVVVGLIRRRSDEA